jgi:hypothetical protein
MILLRSLLLVAFAALATIPRQGSAQPSPVRTSSVPASCPMTPRPARAFIPPPPYRSTEELPRNFFFIGSEKLWTEIGESMVWEWRPHRPGHEQDLTAKIFWFRVGYSWRTEPIPKIKVTGRRLDGEAPPLMLPQGPATNAIMDNSGRGAMLTGVWMPTPGCWEITADYAGDKLSFNVWVEPVKPDAQ